MVIKQEACWSSPPPTLVDAVPNYCIQESAAACNGLAVGYNYVTASPSNGWCSPVTNVDQQSEHYQAHPLASNIRGLSNTGTTSSSTDIGLDSTDGFLSALDGESEEPSSHLWGVDIMPLNNVAFQTSPTSKASSVSGSPVSVNTPRDTTTRHRLESRSIPSSASPPSDAADSGAAKPDEPYAKLIHKAIMTRPDHSMTLQEIYQWFRDNTNKAVTESTGWQNSIRHNLSMNAVRHIRCLPLPYVLMVIVGELPGISAKKNLTLAGL
jgi:hypothetical protein